MSQTKQDYLNFLTAEMVKDGAIVISPRPEPFRSRERSFLDGIRNVPAAISAPPGTNPFTNILGRSGKWVFIWLPD